MNTLLVFVIIFFVSALGSTPPGLINMVVLERTIVAGKKAGVMTAVGTFLPEFLYTFIAVYAYNAINSNVELGQGLKLAGGLVLITLACFYFFRKPEEPKLERTSSRRDSYRGFRKGMFTASINVLIVPFWALTAAYMASHGYDLKSLSNIFAFALGSALGALTVFLSYVRLGPYIVHRLNDLIRYSNKFLALLFLSIGLYQLFRLY